MRTPPELRESFELIKRLELADLQINLQSLSQRTGIWISSMAFLDKYLKQRGEICQVLDSDSMSQDLLDSVQSLSLLQLPKG